MKSKRTPKSFTFPQKPLVLIVKTSFYPEIISELVAGATQVLDRAGALHEILEVPGALEVPTAILFALKAHDTNAERRRYDGFVALGCVLKGETFHDEIVAHTSAEGLQEVAMRFSLAIGNGILTCNTHAQATERASLDHEDRGGFAAEACLRMIELKHHFHISRERRWVAR